MELKEMILSTLKELEEVVPKEETPQSSTPTLQPLQPPRKREERDENQHEESVTPSSLHGENEELSMPSKIAEMIDSDDAYVESQKQFYVNLRERILVLFEGFQSPNNKNIEAKIDLTLNFLEYLLATVDEQLEKMEKFKK